MAQPTVVQEVLTALDRMDREVTHWEAGFLASLLTDDVCPVPDLAALPTSSAPMLDPPVDLWCTLGVLFCECDGLPLLVSSFQYYWARVEVAVKGMIITSGIIGLLVGIGVGGWLSGWQSQRYQDASAIERCAYLGYVGLESTAEAARRGGIAVCYK